MSGLIDNLSSLIPDSLLDIQSKPTVPPLKESLRPASFRKIPFQVESTEFETGRRTQVHEYPQRDKPYSQDMGRSARHIEFDAFVIGADYVKQANNLLGALEAGDSGTLVHPWFGTLKVNVDRCRVSFDNGLGIARFSLAFIEAGELSFPNPANSTKALSRAAAEKLESASVGWFGQVVAFTGQLKAVAGKITAIASQISSIIDQGLTIYGQVLQFVSNPVFALSSLLGFGSLPGNINSLAGLFSSPVDLGWSFAGLLNVSSLAKDGTLTAADVILTNMVRGLTQMSQNTALAAPVIPSFTTATTAQALSNQFAILANTRHLLLVQAVGLSSYLSCSVYDDTVALKNELCAALEAEAAQATDDTLCFALQDARSAVWEDLTTRARDSARLTTIIPDDVMPTLVIAYDYYDDATRDQEIVTRNKISNPNFTPVLPLKVLSQ